ncbi:MAG: hypothetical protein ABFC83_02850 [Synergistaceae bacterium]
MKKTGAIFIEVLVSILLFTVGILALTATLFYGVKVIAESKDETISEQNYKNSVEREILGVILNSPNTPSISKLSSDVFSINTKELPFDLYRYRQEDKEITGMYLLKGE